MEQIFDEAESLGEALRRAGILARKLRRPLSLVSTSGLVSNIALGPALLVVPEQSEVPNAMINQRLATMLACRAQQQQMRLLRQKLIAQREQLEQQRERINEQLKLLEKYYYAGFRDNTD